MTDLRSSPGSRDATTFLWRDLTPFACGALTMLATSLALLPDGDRASPLQVWIGFVPVGAIVAGACAASGYYLGALATRRRPTPMAAALMCVSTIPVYAAMCLLPLQWTAGPWATAPGLPGANAGASMVIRAMSLDPSGLNAASATGALAYALVILAGLGFAVGAAAVVHLLAAPIHCHKCRKYLRRAADWQAAWTTCDFDPSAPAGAFGRTAVPVVARRPRAAQSDA